MKSQYVAVLYKAGAPHTVLRSAVRQCYARSGLKLDSEGVSIFNAEGSNANPRTWPADQMKLAMQEYERRRFSRSSVRKKERFGTLVGVILCEESNKDALDQSMEIGIIPKDTHVYSLEEPSEKSDIFKNMARQAEAMVRHGNSDALAALEWKGER